MRLRHFSVPFIGQHLGTPRKPQTEPPVPGLHEATPPPPALLRGRSERQPCREGDAAGPQASLPHLTALLWDLGQIPWPLKQSPHLSDGAGGGGGEGQAGK